MKVIENWPFELRNFLVCLRVHLDTSLLYHRCSIRREIFLYLYIYIFLHELLADLTSSVIRVTVSLFSRSVFSVERDLSVVVQFFILIFQVLYDI